MTNDHEILFDMFRYKRPAGCQAETDFIDRFLLPLGFKPDRFGNHWVEIGQDSTILFSSHSDTVHRDGGFQTLQYDGKYLTSDSNCLGADDTSGVWLMMEMVKAQIPGLYVIHYGEERGCIGSRALAEQDPKFFTGLKMAIAFDRSYTDDIITHQTGRRTASDAFAKSFASQLGGGFRPSSNGIYTDTNEYAHLIPECTNVSVGYSGAHSPMEKQDIPFLIDLRDRLLKVDWSKLVVARDHMAEEYENQYVFTPRRKERRPAKLSDLVYEYPEIATEILQAHGIDAELFQECVEDMYGVRSAA